MGVSRLDPGPAGLYALTYGLPDVITIEAGKRGGKPCIRGLRIPVATVLRMLAGGMTEQEILAEYPDLESEDVRECLRFAASSERERELPLPRSAWDFRSLASPHGSTFREPQTHGGASNPATLPKCPYR